MNIKCLKSLNAILPFLVLTCVLLLSSCGEKTYYHDDTTLNNLKGSVSRIYDSSYFATVDLDTGTDSIVNFGTVEYIMDENNHLVEENYTQYVIRKAIDGSRTDTLSYVHRFNHYTYNPKGRKSDTREISRTVGEDYMLDDTISTRLVNRDGNVEIWVLETSSNYMDGKTKLYTTVTYAEDSRQMTFNAADNQIENQAYTVHRFGKDGRLTEYIIANEYGDVVLNDTYEYNADGYVEKKISKSTDFTNEDFITRYEPGDWDDKGNWRTQKEYDGEGNLRQITHRRIEYR